MKYLLIFAVFISKLICNPHKERKKSLKIQHMFYIVCIMKRVSVKRLLCLSMGRSLGLVVLTSDNMI